MKFLEKVYIPMDVKKAVRDVSKKEDGVIFIATHQSIHKKSTGKVRLEFINQHLLEEKDMVIMNRQELIDLVVDLTGKSKRKIQLFLNKKDKK